MIIKVFGDGNCGTKQKVLPRLYLANQNSRLRAAGLHTVGGVLCE
jgi:hypothetical protein